MYMYVCMCIYTYTYTYTYTHIYSDMFVFTYMSIYICMHVDRIPEVYNSGIKVIDARGNARQKRDRRSRIHSIPNHVAEIRARVSMGLFCVSLVMSVWASLVK